MIRSVLLEPAVRTVCSDRLQHAAARSGLFNFPLKGIQRSCKAPMGTICRRLAHLETQTEKFTISSKN